MLKAKTIRISLLLLGLLCGSFSFSSSVKVAILTEVKITTALVSSHIGEYIIYADGLKIADLKKNQSVQFIVTGDSVQVNYLSNKMGVFKRIKLIGQDAPNSFNIKPLNPEKTLRVFDHNLEITALKGFLRLINVVNLEYYVAGVVEAENGIKQNFEYYKLKSIICRTYALSNIRRHEAEGFNLCDQVHCQVYKAKNRANDEILLAALSTTGMVIADNDLKLITAAFHSNCGGQTVNSEDVWSLPTTYLKSRVDSFCIRQPQAHWEQKVPVQKWIEYLKRNHNYEHKEDFHAECAYNYFQYERETEFVSHELRVPLKSIRSDFRLKSTFFVFEPDGDSIIFRGKGFGHGVGLCQEGAMKMATLGFKYHEILHFYYKDVHLVDLSVLDFFRSEN
jgi:stage II sporulation protein D